MSYLAPFSALILALAMSSNGNTIRSETTVIELDKCVKAATHRDGGEWNCGGGFKGYEVYFAEGDLRQFLAYGKNAKKQASARQTIPQFNSIFKGDAAQAEIEWRVRGTGAGRQPIATIVRYYTDSGMGEGAKDRSEVLVVTRLGKPDGIVACHVAYVDGLANRDALELARSAADEHGGSFDCKKDPMRLGKARAQ